MTVTELTIHSRATYAPVQFAAAVDLLATGRAVSQPLITQQYPLGDVADAFEKQLDKESTVRVMVTMIE